MFIAGIITGILISVAAVFVLAPKIMFIVSESKYDFETTKTLLEESTKAEEWSMPHQYDLQATMQKHGFSVKPVTVYSICKPEIAVNILGDDNKRHVSSMMPCRIAVYEKTNGKTYVARMNAELIAKLLGKELHTIMGEAGTGSEKILQPILK